MSLSTPRHIKNAGIRGSNQWVEIIEPKTKQKIYADLETGLCAKKPPDGAIVRRSEDFSDHWWELYDQKTGKYYYYNPEQQKTAWARPTEPAISNGGRDKKLLIIPVAKLQTFKKLSFNYQDVEKCDASTQTIASNLVSTGTQTISDTDIESEFNHRLRLIDPSNESSKSSSSCTHSSSTSKSYLRHRQSSDFDGKEGTSYLKGKLRNRQRISATPKQDESSHNCPVNRNGDQLSYYGLQSSDIGQAKLGGDSPCRHDQSNDQSNSSTSAFINPNKPPIGSSKPQKIATNNLSHYLVREARAMGIALISDDEVDDDDDQESEDDFAVEDDEDTDIRDDMSNHRSDLATSRDFEEDSSEGWKSFSDQESPNDIASKSNNSKQKSPLHCETPASFTFSELMDDEKDPASCMSQQLDHRKLVENFKKSRQTSSFGIHDSLGRSCKLEANNAVQKIKSVADSYFHNDKDSASDRHLRQLSTLSTLPRSHRQTKDKIALSKPDEPGGHLDADYDVVEENCGYYSDSEKANQSVGADLNTANKSSTKSSVDCEPQSSSIPFDRNKSSRGSTFSVESFARENLTRHPKKGGLLFNRKVKWSRMITWTKSSIKQPMISSVSQDLNSDSIASFKLIQQFMGDRKVTITKKYRQIIAQYNNGSQDETGGKRKHHPKSSSNTSGSGTGGVSNVPTIPDRLRDELAYELVVKGCQKPALRDEIYVQLARQLTENPNQESVVWGLILVSILFSYFSPSSKFSPFLLSFLETHPHQMATDVCLPRLDKRLRQNWLTYCRKPADGNEISIVRLSITKWPQYCGVFGESLERIMSLQACSPYLKTLRLPWILTTLGSKLIETGGPETEGIFRCAADHDLIAQLRLEIDCVDFRKITDSNQIRSLLSNVQDPHVIAGLLKLFFRQLYEPVFPTQLYETCLQSGQDGHMACRVFNERLPNLNKDVVAYLIRLLQLLSTPDKVAISKMDNSNLSMVWAPNLLRLPYQPSENLASSTRGSKWSIANGTVGDDQQQQQSSAQTSASGAATQMASSQSMIFEQTRQEMQFIRSLIVHLDTSFIENVS